MVGSFLGLFPVVYWSWSSSTYGSSLNCVSIRGAPFLIGNTLFSPTKFLLNSARSLRIWVGTFCPTLSARMSYLLMRMPFITVISMASSSCSSALVRSSRPCSAISDIKAESHSLLSQDSVVLALRPFRRDLVLRLRRLPVCCRC